MLTATGFGAGSRGAGSRPRRGHRCVRRERRSGRSGLQGRSGLVGRPPSENDVGLDAVAATPEMTDVGGTTVSTDAGGQWRDEQTWFSPTLSHGTGGGVSALFPRPYWQDGVASSRGSRSATDPRRRGRSRPVHRRQDRLRPTARWLAGALPRQPRSGQELTAVMDQYLKAHGGKSLGDLNPLLYRVAAGSRSTGLP